MPNTTRPGWTVRVDIALDPGRSRSRDCRSLRELFGVREGGHRLYEDFELTIKPGEVVAVCGPSGAGKSLLLRAVARKARGCCRVRTGDLAQKSQPAVECLTGGTLAQRLDLLSRCGLAEAPVLATPARCLSGGQMYRLAVARALHEAARRKAQVLILADEFGAAVDEATAAVLARQLRRIISSSDRLALLVATVQPELLVHLKPDRLLVKPLNQPPRWVRPPRGRGIDPSDWPIEEGSIRDYRGLESFHYLAGPPAAHKRVYVVRAPRKWAQAGGTDLAAVCVVSPPVLRVRARNIATGGRYMLGADGDGVGRLNREVECISRVIVHPVYRSCGLAARLVRHAMDQARAPVVESMAVMGRVHPMFERAGMDPWPGLGCHRPYVYYLHFRRFSDSADAAPTNSDSEAATIDAPPNSETDAAPADDHPPSPAPAGSRCGDRAIPATQPLPDQPPGNPSELAALVQRHLGIKVPAKILCPGHQPPLDYLCASFFDQQDLLIWANRGGGKTLMAAVATILDAVYRAPIHIRVLGGSFDQSDRLADYIRDLLAARPELLAGPMTRQRVRLVGGSEVRMLAQSQRAVRGQHVQKIRCDEVDLFDPEVWRAVQFATRSVGSSRGSIEVLSTLHRPGGLMQELVDLSQSSANAPPGAGGYRMIRWCLWEVIEACPSWRRCENCPLAADCQGLARQAEGFFRIDDAITILARSSRAAWEAEMLCRGPQREHLVLGEFDTARHVAGVEYCPDWPLYRAMDFGYTSPLVCLWVQVSPGGGVHVLDEYVRARLPLAAHAAEILRRDPGPIAMTYVDPAGRQKESTSGAACTELLTAAGIPCTWRASTIGEGLELIRSVLAPASGEVKLQIHPRCRQLIKAFGEYHYGDLDRSGDAKPIKDGPDHLIDALRYFFVNRVRPCIVIRRGRY